MEMTKKELNQILADHAKWLLNPDKGKRADLQNTDLRFAYLGGTDLRFAILRDTYLGGANLRDAILGDADFWNTDLRGADLQNTDLRDAILRGADLRFAILRDADLGGANLRDAILRGADLREARMADVILSEAKGVIWAQRGPIGVGHRTDTAVWVDGQVIHHAGCFTGTRSDYEARITNGGWNWPDADRDRLAARCRRMADECEADIHEWLSVC